MTSFGQLKRGPTCLANIGFSVGHVGFDSGVGSVIGRSSALIFIAPSPCLGARLGGLGAHVESGFVVATVGKVMPSGGLVMSRCFAGRCNIPPRGVTILTNPYRTRRMTLRHLSCLAVTYPSASGTQVFTHELKDGFVGASVDSSMSNVRCDSMLGGMCTVTTNVYDKLGCNSGFRTILVSGTVRRVEHFLSAMRPLGEGMSRSICLKSLLMAKCSGFDHGHAFNAVVNGKCSIGDTRVRVRVVTRKCCNAGYVGRVGGRRRIGVPVLSTICGVLCRHVSPVVRVGLLASSFE